MRRVLEYLPILSGCLLYFGFCNLYYFYQEFNLEVFSFISSTDILLSFFPKIVLISSTFYSTIFLQLLNNFKNDTNTNKELKDGFWQSKTGDWFISNIYYIILLYYLPIFIIQIILKWLFDLRPYDLVEYNLLFDFIFLGLIYLATIIHNEKNVIQRKPILVALFLIIFIGQKIGSYSRQDAQKIKAGISEYSNDHLSFNYHNNIVKTTDSLISVGQTSRYLFLFNLKTNTTQVYPFEKMENLLIK